MLNEDFNLRDKGTSNAQSTVNKARHRWYYYKEGFSPELVKSAIEDINLGSNESIMDPFNGSGTVTLTAANLGFKSIGFEVNPFTSFIAKAKTLTPNIDNIRDDINHTLNVLNNEKKKSYLEGYSTFTRHNKKNRERRNKWLFNTRVIRTFTAGYELHKEKNTASSELIKLALIAAAMDNCNAKKDGKCLRYKNGWRELRYGKESFIESFQTYINDIVSDLTEPIINNPELKTGDSRKLISDYSDKFKLCITSPPYLNTFDYTDIYRPELFLGEFVTSSEELYNLRFETIRSHVQVKWKEVQDLSFGALFNDVYNEIDNNQDSLMNNQILPMIAAYFADMEQILKSLKDKAQKGASLWLVVGTSAYANNHVPVDLILADIATKVGWELREIGVLRKIRKRKTKYSPDIDMLRESVVILDN